jgi:hypothetical protein
MIPAVALNFWGQNQYKLLQYINLHLFLFLNFPLKQKITALVNCVFYFQLKTNLVK